MKLLKKIKNWWKDNQEKSSEEYLEREELKKSLEDYKKDISVILNARFHEQFSGDRALHIASLIQNVHLQKKLTKATDGLKTATWILALATTIFAWVAIKDSPNSNEIIQTLQGISMVIIYFIIIVIVMTLIWKFVTFTSKRIKVFFNNKKR